MEAPVSGCNLTASTTANAFQWFAELKLGGSPVGCTLRRHSCRASAVSRSNLNSQATAFTNFFIGGLT